MSWYRRDRTPGATWFFTVLTDHRWPWLCEAGARYALRSAFDATRLGHAFAIDAFVLLPDHLHCVMTLPEGDADFSLRWSQVKRRTTWALRDHPTLSRARWQRRFWEHRIRNEDDLARHVDYIHFNPVKHGLVDRVSEWPHSSFHRFVAHGDLARDWGDRPPDVSGRFGE
ncbi:MAG TPA: transposase [Xanthomonadales bacterium]|nr:transposase [Xanthomonadales bacterium]